MESPHTARPRAPSKSREGASPPAATPRRGRPPTGAPPAGSIRDYPGVTVRLPPELLARVDTEVNRRNAALAKQGAATSRGAVLVIAVREFCDRAEADAREKGGAS